MEFVLDVLGNREVYSLGIHDSVTEAARQMAFRQVGAILVLDHGELKGLFSERDLLTRVVAEGRDPDFTLVSEVMTTDVVAIDETSSVQHAAELMRHYGFRHLPVVRGHIALGVISMRDLLPLAIEAATAAMVGSVRSYQ
jgi:CBS domain-containing protein